MSKTDRTTVRVAGLICDGDERILLAEHRKDNRNYYVLPGGHLEFGETIAKCAERELQEEAGLICKWERPVYLSESISPDGRRHIINIYGLMSIIGGELAVSSDEDILQRVLWVPLASLASLQLFPQISSQIIKDHMSGWNNESIVMLSTPWE